MQAPYVFTVDQGYFYVPSVDLPYQFRTALVSERGIIRKKRQPESRFKVHLIYCGKPG